MTKVSRHGSHFQSNGGVVIGQIGMAGAGIDDAENMAGLGKIIICLPHYRSGGVPEVNGYRAADGSPHLVHQAAGLAKIDVFGVLTDLCQLHRIQFSTAEKVV